MMLAHDIVGKKEDELKIYLARERVQFTIIWCEIYGVIC